jgi:hypothetical protein
MSTRHLLLPASVALLALSACGSPAASTPAAAPASASSSAAPTTAASVPPSAATTASVPAVATTTPHATAVSSRCPSANALAKLVELPKGVSFGGVQCSQGWAAADPQGAGVGDGVYLFKFRSGTGWRYYDQGSGIDCKDLGLTRAPFCISAPAAPAGSVSCPSATALEKLVELPKGASFGGVQCSQGWAAADPQGPGVGDGVYLFKYKAGTGWRYYDQGSGIDCADLGLKRPAPFCIS